MSEECCGLIRRFRLTCVTWNCFESHTLLLCSGAAQAAFLATILWTLTTNLSGYFDSRPLPSNYTASNITVAVKTAVEVRQNVT